MKSKKHLLIVSSVFLPEPVVSAILLSDLAEKLSKKYNVTVLRPYPTRPLGFKIPKFNTSCLPYEIIELRSYTHPKSSLFGRLLESYSMGKHSVKYIKNNHSNIDLIYNAPWQLFGRYMIAKSARKYNIPFITPVQDIYPESLLSKLPKWRIFKSLVTIFLLRFDKVTLSYAAMVHTISEKMKRYLAETRNIDETRFIVITNWHNESQFIEYRNQKNIEKPNINPFFTFMYLGNIGPLAGIEVIVNAFIRANIKNSLLVIAGSGSAKVNLMKQAKLYPKSKIEFWDVPSGEVPKIQAQADVMILPLKKGFSATSVPSKLPAYMFSAKPIIAAVDADSDTALPIVNSECGWLSEPENVEMLAEFMIQAHSTDKVQLEEMGEKGFQYAMKYFSRKNNLSKLCKVCEDVTLVSKNK